jgi:hypothetical protein
MRALSRRGLTLMVLGLLVLLVAGAGPAAWDRTHRPDADEQRRPGYDYAVAAPLSSYDDPRVQREPRENPLAYAARATDVVFRAIYHCEPTQTQQQTWATALLSRVTSDVPSAEGVLNPRGLRCGFCHQVAFGLAEILRRNGISGADARGLDGHVITTFEQDGRSYAADPDLGVAPFVVDWDDPDQLQDAVRVAYRGYDDNPDYVEALATIYSDTSTDGTYGGSHEQLLALANQQKRLLQQVNAARWGVVGLAGLLVVATLAGPAARRLRRT